MKNLKMIIGLMRFLASLWIFLICTSALSAQKRPVIGLSDLYKEGRSSAPRSYVDAVLAVGAVPVVIPLMYDDEKIIELLNTLDGIIFTGGEDFDPSYYREQPIPQMGKINVPRDEFDIKLIHLAVRHNVPVLGICRGIQLINVAFGGSLYQDLSAQYTDKFIGHRQTSPYDVVTHEVYVEKNTIFSDIVKERKLMVNSFHHQAIKKLAPGFVVAGRSPDKVIEAIERIDADHWILGVQFHPEHLVLQDPAMKNIFKSFVDEAGRKETVSRHVRTVVEPSRETYRQTHVPSIVQRNVIDTMIVYKFVRDTIYLSPEPDVIVEHKTDTVKILVKEKELVYVKDTIFVPVEHVASVSTPANNVIPVTDTLIYNTNTPDENFTAKDSVKLKKKEEKEAKIAVIAAEKAEKKAAKEKAAAEKKAAGKNEKAAGKESKKLEKESKKAAGKLEQERIKELIKTRKAENKAKKEAKKALKSR